MRSKGFINDVNNYPLQSGHWALFEKCLALIRRKGGKSRRSGDRHLLLLGTIVLFLFPFSLLLLSTHSPPIIISTVST